MRNSQEKLLNSLMQIGLTIIAGGARAARSGS